MIHRLTRKEHAEWHRQWLSVYAIGVFQRTGKWSVNGQDDRAFDARFMKRVLRGAAAEVEYELAIADTFVILFEGGTNSLGEYRENQGAKKPTVGELKQLATDGDFLLFPSDLAWSAFFHHEERFPTLFARREWVSDVAE